MALLSEEDARNMAENFLLNSKDLSITSLSKIILQVQEKASNFNFEGALDNFQAMAHGMAKSKGWWEPEVAKRPLECHALMVSEICEAMEAWRAKKPPFYKAFSDFEVLPGEPDFEIFDGKPEGEAIELADAVIRIMDYFGHKGWSLAEMIVMKHAYNAGREKMHGGKRA